jgi:hypothetical protein
MKMILTSATNAEEYAAVLTGWQGSFVHALRKLVIDTAPELEERLKWGHLVYFGQGPAILIRSDQNRVLFGFWRGKRLVQLEPRLRGNGKYELKSLELRENTSFGQDVARRLVLEAVALDRALGDPTKDAKARSAA